MFHARGDWIEAAPAAALAPRLAPAFGRRAEPFSLAVDLADDVFSKRWWRGAATLALLCGTALSLSPRLQPLMPPSVEPLAGRERTQAEALAIAPLSNGSSTGLRMAPSEAVTPLEFAPQRTTVELFMTLGAGDSVASLLARAGATRADTAQAVALVRSAGDGVAPGTSVAIVLGALTSGGARALDKLTLRAGLGVTLTVQRGANGLELRRTALPVDTTPLRIRGQVGDGFYWSLRAAGVSPAAAADYLRAIGGRLDVGGDIAPNDRFDLIIANRRSASGESQAGPLLYAGLDRAGGSDVQLMRWKAAGRTDWFDANSGGEQRAAGMMWPVSGRITSGFGYRTHPILRFKRLHRGLDFGAGHGTPIVAAADGQVVKAGWAGGYGRQVRIAHGGGTVTSYSHMSSMAAEPGAMVRQGQVIGYVGSSGLSTGPHLHYEVHRGGVAVNPLSVRFASTPVIDAAQQGAFKARLKALLSVGVRKS